MSDDLNLRARLTGEDSLSPLVQRIVSQFDRLEKKLKALGQNYRNPIAGLDDKYIKQLQKGGKEIDGLTEKYMRWARYQRDFGKMSSTQWTKMTNELQGYHDRFDKLNRKEMKAYAEKVKRAQAYSAVWNSQAKERVRIEDNMRDQINRIDVEHLRQEERRNRDHQNRMLSARRQFVQQVNKIYQGVRRLGYAELGAAAGVGAMGASSVRSAVDLDKAEFNARINMDQSQVNARQLRDMWALPRAVALGQNPARLMETAADAAKAGVPEKLAAGTAEMVTKLAKTMGIDAAQAMEGMGYAIAQEIGAGRMSDTDIKPIRRLANTSAYLANKTSARPDQMFSFLRTGMGSGAKLGLDQETTLAFGASAIQAGAQGQQASRFLGSFGADIYGLQMKARDIQRKGGNRSQEDKLFLSLPSKLGFGSYGNLIQGFRKDPNNAIFDLIKSFGKIKDNIQREQAMDALFGSGFGRFLANMVESPAMLDRTRALSREAMGQSEETDFISKSWQEFTNSLEYFVDKVKATWTVLKDELGDVLKPYIQQFSSWVEDWYTTVKTSGIKERFAGFLSGLTEGFLGHPGSFRDLLDKAFGKPGEKSGSSADDFMKLGKGFAEGIKSVAKAFVSISAYFGNNSADPEAIGRFAGKIVALVGALTLLSPLISVMGLVVSSLFMLGSALKFLSDLGVLKFLAKITGLKAGKDMALQFGAKAAGKVGLGALGGWMGMLLYGDGRPDNSPEDMKGLQDELRNYYEKNGKLKKKTSGEGFDPSMVHPAAYYTRSSVDDLSDQLKKFGGMVERASFITTTGGAIRGAGFVGGGGLSSSYGSSSGISLGGGSGSPMALIHSTPGARLPNFGVGSGGIIKRSNIPSFSGGGGSAGGLSKSAYERVFAGTPLAGMYDNVVAAAKANGVDPALLASVMAHETGKGSVLTGNNPGGIMDPATGMARKMQFGSLAQGIDRTAATVAKNYQRAGGSIDALGRIYAPVGAANDPRGLNGGWAAGVKGYLSQMSGSDQASGLGDPVKTAERFLNKNEWRDTKEIANFIKADPRGNVNAWCARFVNAALKENGVQGTGSAAAASFYKWGSAVEGAVKRNDIMVSPHHVGMATGKVDENGNIQMISGNHGDSVQYSWEPRGKYQLRRATPGLVSGVPDPKSVTRGVPSTPIPGAGASDIRRNPGNVAIHINGGSHDPEALATLVQRRIDEQMNWRIHDSESEYT
ncbi:phage tail tape measure protein [Bradyrhizobium erythrophlei]|uniref:Phage tail tape measure protein, TP901 family, core region n=1 Tax=Bradyrhizobium erythrophlei TaxID=1437360 RepID=A0A1M5PYB0_9BRAD|nr:phage tail tape measure protein [Bradyrhizobium erythrophlei]SHH06642.1 phage tail tape measure protein, TP901 family, core region [Bradyrhizobium erythrophlei]